MDQRSPADQAEREARGTACLPVRQLPMTEDRLLNATEVAELLSVPVTWVYERTRANDIPHVRLGRYRRYRREAILDWLEEQEKGRFRKHQPALKGTK
jgi:excisionase family DNA binding protein